MPYSRFIAGGLPWYSVLVVSGMLAAILLASREEKRLGLPKDTTMDLALILLPAGILGARLYYVAFSWETYAADPVRILYIWEGGLAIYGGVIGGVLALALFARRRKLPLPLLADMVIPGVALAQAIGRWGNFFNMEAYGAEILSGAWQFFPAGVLIPSADGAAHWHLATFFYESVWDLGVFTALWRSRKRKRRDGDLLLGYLLLYGAGRLVIEGLRTDSLMAADGVRVSQLLSACMCLAAAAVPCARLWRRDGRKLLALAALIPAALTFALYARRAEPWAGYRLLAALADAAALAAALAILQSGGRRAAGIILAACAGASAAARLTTASALPGLAAETAMAAVLAAECIMTALAAGAALVTLDAKEEGTCRRQA